MNEDMLDYAPRRRRPLTWRVVVCCLIAAAAISGYFLVSWLGQQISDWRIRRAHDASAHCVLDPGKPTLTFDGKALPLGKNSPLSEGEKAVETLALGLPGCDLVFAHERRTRGGSSRIVIVQAVRFSITNGDPFFTYRVLGPAIPGDPKGVLSGDDLDVRTADGTAISPVANHPMAIYYGQADAADESHFWFEYEIDGKRGIVDGYLVDNPHPGRAEYVRLIDRVSK